MFNVRHVFRARRSLEHAWAETRAESHETVILEEDEAWLDTEVGEAARTEPLAQPAA